MSGRAHPQAVYTSAPRTLEGPGFGVFAHSPDWPAGVGRTRKALGALVGFRPDAGEAYGLLQRGAGRVLYRKVAASADGFGRPGNYLVHLVWDGGGRLGARDVLALRRAGRFLDALPDGTAPTAEYPPLRVPPAPRALPALPPEEVDALTPSLALLLAALAVGAGTCALPRRTPSGREVADVVFDVLPRALAATVTLHAGPREDDGDTAAVVVELAEAGPARASAAGRRLVAGPSPEGLAVYRDAFFDALRNDFNTAEALASLYGWIREANRSAEAVGNAHLVEMLDVLGLSGLLAAEEGAPPVAVALAEHRETARRE